MNNSQEKLHNIFEAYKKTSGFKDSSMMEVFSRKQEFEKNLDEMWSISRSGNLQQLPIYKKQVKYLGSIGITTLRNSAGKHKLVLKK